MRANKKKLGSRGESASVQGTVWRWAKKKKKPLRRGGWVVHNKRKGVSPERSGGHQFCHFLAYSVIYISLTKEKNDFYF